MRKDLVLDFSDISGGKNNAFPPHALNENQCTDTLNLLHERNGLSRAPGYLGVATEDYRFNCIFNYIHDDGTISIIIHHGSHLYVFNPSDNSLTEIGETSESNNQWYGVNACGKFWLCNGIDFLKIEDDLTVYNVGIPSPDYAGLYQTSGGYLDDGTYSVYYCHARKDSFGRYLYSYPYYCGEITLSQSNAGQVGVVWGKMETDPQITHVVFFMTDADGAVVYYYGETDYPSGTYPFLIDGSTRNELITMSAVASSNVPLSITPNGIFAFDDRIYVWEIGNKNIYWSLKSDVNPFDLERFIPENFRTMPMQVNGMFSIGPDLYFNHVGHGISTAYYGDMGSVIKHVQKQFWFIETFTEGPKTDATYVKGIVFGLTNDGFRFFDGATFSDDISFHIKPDIDKIYNNLTELPCAIVYRRPGKRTEYRFCFENLDYSSQGNNCQLVFNLDFYFDPFQSKACWEYWENGFTNMLVSGNTWFAIQSTASLSFIVKESGTTDMDCYNKAHHHVTEPFLKSVYLLTRTYMDDLDSICIWGSIYGLATSTDTISGNIIIFDANNTKYPFQLVGVATGQAILPSAASGLGLALPFIMAPQTPRNTVVPMPWDCRGNTVAIEISQRADDPDFFIYKLQLPRIRKERNNLT